VATIRTTEARGSVLLTPDLSALTCGGWDMALCSARSLRFSIIS
jgi:hypothetical protein